MTDRIDPATLTDPRDQAAYWYERVHAEDLSPAERAAFEQWRQASPAHEQHYQQVQYLWRMAAALPKSAVQQLGAVPPSGALRRPPRRVALQYGVGLACAAALTLAVVDPLHWRATPAYQAHYATAHGERRHVVLPDDSSLLLNTDTTASVALYTHRRTVRLEEGEVFFQVDGTQGTPFIIEMDHGTVRVTGTTFNVRRTGQTLAVDVLQGAVEVRTGSWWNRQTALLKAGEVARVSPSGSLVTYQDAQIDNTVAWREGKVVFRGTALAQAVQELNRYSAQPLVVRDAHIRSLQVSGVFSIDDPDAFLAALPHILPVAVHPRPDGSAVDILAR